MATSIDRKRIAVYAHWHGLAAPALMGELLATPVRGQEVFSFAYASSWLATAPAQVLDPALQLESIKKCGAVGLGGHRHQFCR